MNLSIKVCAWFISVSLNYEKYLKRLDRPSPESVSITQDFDGSSEAKVKWSFPAHAASDVPHFTLFVKKDGDEVELFSEDVPGSCTEGTIRHLDCDTQYEVIVTAIYRDDNDRRISIQHHNKSKLIIIIPVN